MTGEPSTSLGPVFAFGLILLGKTRHFSAGQVIPETIDAWHTGVVGDESAAFIVFCAGVKRLALSKVDVNEVQTALVPMLRSTVAPAPGHRPGVVRATRRGMP